MKKVLIQPIISEKSYKKAQDGVYSFMVTKDSNKMQIKDAIENQFKVTVTQVRTITIPGKRVRFGRRAKMGRRQDIKKAFVTLKDGDKIALFEV